MGAKTTFSPVGVWSATTLPCTGVAVPCRSLTVRRALCTSALGIAVPRRRRSRMAEEPGAGGASLDELEYAGGGLAKETNWWGAFVIGLAGTILVTGIAPVMVTSLGAASIPLIIGLTITGYLLCLLLAELSAMMPERTGGAPSYAYPAFRDRFPRMAPHVNGVTSWMYWLGWFPVAPLNMILASFYIADR